MFTTMQNLKHTILMAFGILHLCHLSLMQNTQKMNDRSSSHVRKHMRAGT